MPAKPNSTASRPTALDPFHAQIARWRNAGLSLQDIVHGLAGQGVVVNRNAVDRFCKKHGILPSPKTAVDNSHSYVSFQVTKTQNRDKPESKIQKAEPRAVPREPRPRLPESPVDKPVHQHQTELAIGAAAKAHGPSHAEIITTTLKSFPGSPVVDTVMAPVEPHGLTAEQLAGARVLSAGAPIREAIDEAWKAQDPKRLEAALRASVDWLESIRGKVPASFHEAIKNALAETQPWLEAAKAAQSSAASTTAASLPLKQLSSAAPSSALFAPLPRAPVWTPDLELVSFNDQDAWTLQDACEGTLILGATGSGKTSGSGRTIACSFLDAHFGGLVLTAKESEAGLWERYASETGRSEQLCRVASGQAFRFNFLDYQARLPDDQGGSTENVVELLQTILDAFSRGGGGRRSGDDGSFWVNTSRQLFRNAIRVLKATGTALTFATLRSFMTEAPQSLDDAKAESWRQAPTFGKLITAIENRSGTPSPEIAESLRYWKVEFPSLNPKTRSIVVTDVTAMVDLFFDPTLNELLCSDTTITPEAVFDGAIIVLDLPIEKWLSIGRMAQVVWKYFLQLAVRRRADDDDASRRPVFLWADEFQHFLAGESDAAFQATARSSRCATVYLTQTIPGLSIQAGSPLPKERVDALTANLSTKIFHANADPTTNQWAAEQIGKSMQYRASITTGDEPAQRGWGFLDHLLSLGRSSAKVSTSPVVDFDLQPGEFAKLRTGSKRFKGQVDAVVLKNGKTFSSGSHWLKTTFLQSEPSPNERTKRP